MSHVHYQDSAAPVILWQLSDGRRGHLSQSTGLVKALQRHIALEPYLVDAPPLRAALGSCLSKRTKWAPALPAPQVVIGAGHATHLPLLAIGRAHHAKTVVLMRPSLPLGWFDYCLVPAHDKPPARDNVIVTQGAVNPMQPGRAHDPERGLVLVGGPSRHYGFDTSAILHHVRQILTRAPRRRWTLSNAPRTPAETNRALSGLKSASVEVALWDRCERGWLATELQSSREVWVTEDSVSMMYEALTAGCHVGLIPLARRADSRLHRAIDQLLQERFVTSFSNWLEGAALVAPEKPLDEANRCARLLLDKGLIEAPPAARRPRRAGMKKRGSGTGGRALTVLQLLPALEVGGVERGTVDLADELVRRGHRSLVMSAGGALTADLVRSGACHHAWPVGKKSPLTLLLARRLRRFIMEQRVDVLHARSRLPAWVAYLAWKNIPAPTRPVFITTVHGPYRVNRYSAIMTRGQRVIAVSEFIRGYILDNYPEVDPEQVSVIHRGVDPERFPTGFVPDQRWLERWRMSCPQLQGKTLITLPGRITRWKGHADFVDVITGLRRAGLNVHGLIAGGAQRQHFQRELQRRVARGGLDNDITFLGQRDDLREVLSVSDVVLSLARVPEAFGRTALEALALGRPVVAYAHGGAREVLDELQPAGLVEPGNTRAVIEKIRVFIKTPPTIVPNQTYTLERMLSKTLALYEQALRGCARTS